jgi:hypothetical protein
MQIYNALDLKRGATTELGNKVGAFTQPIQFLPNKDKDEAWGAGCLDWLEMQGIKQIRRNARRFLKNYKLANGIIDKTDYIVEEDNEMQELVDVLTTEDDSAFELKFFPIIPNVINVLMGEFAKRSDKIMYRAVDDRSYNEMMEQKRQMVEQVLMQYAEQTMQETMQKMGLTGKTPEEQQQMQQMMSKESLKNLPQIEQFFKKSYRSMIEEWATHQHNVDMEKFSIRELEMIAFKDMLITDREFWHFKMNEDDYDIEIWNPILTFYHKSPEIRYVSQSNWVGRLDLMTLADVIDKYGYLMTADQLKSLEAIYPVKAAGYMIPGYQNDGSFYDSTRSHSWNVEGPSLGMRQFTSFRDTFVLSNEDVLLQILNESEDLSEVYINGLLRVTTVYWKSQRKIGWLSKYLEDGTYVTMLVDENFKVTEKPEYDTKVIKQPCKDNHIAGEHLEWIWINDIWGGIKIGPNRPTFYGNTDNLGFSPIYLNVKPLRFQFKGDFTIYGCKLPVEGSIYSDRNTRSMSLVDKMKPYQIGYNLTNNQIADILIDELGTVILLDQNSLPRSSMGEDWGKNNLAKAYVAMKDFQMLPLDTSITNTENALNFQHYQVLNLEQTNRLMSRIQLSNHFKMQAFEAIGISPQRMGTVMSQETATGVETAVNQSYSQTEMYFTQHSEYLMPRVHQMRTDLAQYYHSKTPSIRLQYLTSMDEKVNFEINGTDLLSRELNVFVTTKINHKQILEQIRSLALNNNASGASIYDLGNILQADSMAEINRVMKSIEEKTNQRIQEQQQHEKEMQEMAEQNAATRQQEMLQYESDQNERDRENKVRVAEITAAGRSGGVDVNQNEQNDYLDTLKYLNTKDINDQKVQLAKDKQIRDEIISQRQLDLKEKELRTKERIAAQQLAVAKENKNKYDK